MKGQKKIVPRTLNFSPRPGSKKSATEKAQKKTRSVPRPAPNSALKAAPISKSKSASNSSPKLAQKSTKLASKKKKTSTSKVTAKNNRKGNPKNKKGKKTRLIGNKRKSSDSSKEKSKKKRKLPESDTPQSLIVRETGWLRYLEKINDLTSNQNKELDSTQSKAKTGSSFSSTKKQKAIQEFLEAVEESDDFDKSRGKHNWKYSFRLKKVHV